MKRRLFTILSFLSLGVCAFLCALWVRSYWLGDFGEFIGALESRRSATRVSLRYAGVYSSHGRLGFGVTGIEYAPNDPNRHHYPDGKRFVWGTEYCWERNPFTRWPAASRSWTGFDARLTWRDAFGMTTSRGVAIPHWLPVMASAILPLIFFHHHARRILRRRAGRCPSCGYDLRASSDRCPECGCTPLSPLPS